MLDNGLLSDYKSLASYISEKRKFGFMEKNKIKEAFNYADLKHKGIKRNSGEPYIVHPINVAKILIDIDASTNIIIGGLLHDVLEDTDTKYEEIETKFGSEVAQLVDAVTKVSNNIKSAFHNKEKDKVQTFLKILDSFGSVSIKLADKLHNMRTIEHKPIQKQLDTARECLELFVPMAHSSGIYSIKTELEDICFALLHKEKYERIKRYIGGQFAENQDRLNRFIDEIKFKIKTQKISLIQIKHRVKEPYSIYKKMENKNKKLEDVFDILGIRIILKTDEECFKVAALMSRDYGSHIEYYKDYIVNPKPNGYQSMHMLTSPFGVPIEIQIRTKKMDKTAEFGSASHFTYKTGRAKDIQDKYKELDNVETVKSDIVGDYIAVYDSKGEKIILPYESTVIDFVYELDPKIANSMTGARANGQMIPIRNKLSQGDVIDIFASDKIISPKLDWLKYAKTAKAKEEIKKQLTENLGNQSISSKSAKVSILTEEKNLEYLKIQFEKITKNNSSNYQEYLSLAENKEFYKYINIEGVDNVECHLAKCCNPRVGDEDIIGIVSKMGIALHKKSCTNAISYNNAERILEVYWNFSVKPLFYEFELIFTKETSVNIIDKMNRESVANNRNFILTSSVITHNYSEEIDENLYSLKAVFEIKNPEYVQYIDNILSSTIGLLSIGKKELK